jgi:aspartyl-tRNA(Asn)/glutamyl-tRNA(Gln) amidotransferase subunit A
MPAAFCGVFGIKPTFGRIPNWPISNLHQMTHNGPLTRTVADGALMQQVMAGPHPADMMTLDSPKEDYLATLDDGIKGLRVAYSRNLGYLPVDQEVADVVAAAVPAFEEAGAIVEEIDRVWPEDPFDPMERVLWSSGIGGRVGQYLDKYADVMDPGLVACAQEGLRYTTADIMGAWDRRIALYETLRLFFERYDLLVTPTVSVKAFPINRLMPEHWEQHEWDWIRWAGFSYPFNLTWNPAASVPCGFTSDRLPVGLQIVGRRFADGLVFRASRALERHRPWAQERPPL